MGPIPSDPNMHNIYREAPFIIQAACAGEVEIIKILVKAGCSLQDVGHICLSKRRQNSVASNVIGAAAYHGHSKVLDFCLQKLDNSFVDVKAIEHADRTPSKGGPFKPELQDFTPLQLALVTSNQRLEVVKLLFGHDANHNVREAVTNNNILHLAARYSTNEQVLEYVVKNAKLDIFERNADGDTPLTICRSVQNQRGCEIIEECQEVFDETGKKTDELMAELLGQEDKD